MSTSAVTSTQTIAASAVPITTAALTIVTTVGYFRPTVSLSVSTVSRSPSQRVFFLVAPRFLRLPPALKHEAPTVRGRAPTGGDKAARQQQSPMKSSTARHIDERVRVVCCSADDCRFRQFERLIALSASRMSGKTEIVRTPQAFFLVDCPLSIVGPLVVALTGSGINSGVSTLVSTCAFSLPVWPLCRPRHQRCPLAHVADHVRVSPWVPASPGRSESFCEVGCGRGATAQPTAVLAMVVSWICPCRCRPLPE